jgi:hypothetical protein
MPLSMIAGIHCIATEAGNGELSGSFACMVFTGINLKTNTGTYLIRQIMLNNVMSKRKIPKRLKCALLIKAWNYHIEGRSIKTLRMLSGEKFPTIIKD